MNLPSENNNKTSASQRETQDIAKAFSGHTLMMAHYLRMTLQGA